VNDRASRGATAGVMMAALPVRRGYGPTLGELLAPWWHATSRVWHVVVVVVAVAAVAAAVGAGLTLENAHYSHGGSVPFGFSYRDLYSVRPEAGEFVKVESRWRDGALKYSYAVGPVKLPAYSGEPMAELPLFATRFIHALGGRLRGFELRGEGKTRVNNTLTGYQVVFMADVAGEELYGRDVLLVPQRAGAREGVVVSMLTALKASAQVASPMEVGETGVLLRPLKTFAFG
jgi:hypothetical protein